MSETIKCSKCGAIGGKFVRGELRCLKCGAVISESDPTSNLELSKFVKDRKRYGNK